MTFTRVSARLAPAIVLAVFGGSLGFGGEAAPKVEFKTEPGSVRISIGGKPFATYVYKDEKITRPYFAHVRAPGEIQVTRNHPPIEGQDPTDHATYHPGIWLTFGDINGNDYWRLKARTVHDGFVEPPRGGPGRGTFTVRNRYLEQGGAKVVCTEICRYTIQVFEYRYALKWESTFSSESGPFRFGDQEEFGLGIRVATPISAREGGEIIDSKGRKNEKAVWGKQAEWCTYRGKVDGKTVGITIVPDPKNFRPCWFHARDYGLLVANPFGRKAMTHGEESTVVVPPGEKFRLAYTVSVFVIPTVLDFDPFAPDPKTGKKGARPQGNARPTRNSRSPA